MSLKLLVNDEVIYKALQEHVDYLIEKEQKLLEHQTDPILIYKAQGALANLRKFKNLRETVNAK